jgi:hypothetical protein
MTKWRGPLLVVEVNGNLVKCQDLITQEVNDYHIEMLKPYVAFRDEDPQKTALPDHEEYVIEFIVDHRILDPTRPRSRKSVEFFVKWYGYSEEQNTWEPYSLLRDAEALDVYIQEHAELCWLLRR